MQRKATAFGNAKRKYFPCIFAFIRWRKERLTTGQAQELDRLEKATVQTQELVQRILDMATAMQAYTIDKMLAKEGYPLKAGHHYTTMISGF